MPDALFSIVTPRAGPDEAWKKAFERLVAQQYALPFCDHQVLVKLVRLLFGFPLVSCFEASLEVRTTAKGSFDAAVPSVFRAVGALVQQDPLIDIPAWVKLPLVELRHRLGLGLGFGNPETLWEDQGESIQVQPDGMGEAPVGLTTLYPIWETVGNVSMGGLAEPLHTDSQCLRFNTSISTCSCSRSNRWWLGG